jgi:16S rRNA (uracil1498-N3)-methyltransferase
MRLHRFIQPVDLTARRLIVKDGEFLNQVKRVFRLHPDDELLLSDGKGKEARARIVEMTPKQLELEIIEVLQKSNELPVRTILYSSILKRENFELVVQKTTEVGVSEIVPVITRRTVKMGVKRDRLQKIVREAAEQSGRAVVPEMFEPVSFERAVEMARANKKNIFFDLDAPALHVSKLNLGSGDRTGIFIGPEGGWDPEEVALIARVPHIDLASLSPLTLRAETAAIIATYLLCIPCPS